MSALQRNLYRLFTNDAVHQLMRSEEITRACINLQKKCTANKPVKRKALWFVIDIFLNKILDINKGLLSALGHKSM